MLEIMIPLSELVTIILFLLGATALIFIILVLSKLLNVLKNVNSIVEGNKENIDKTIEKLPGITDNALEITDMLKNNMSDIQGVFESIGKISDTVKKGVDTINNDIILKAKSIVDIIDAVKKMFDKKKETVKKRKGTVYKYKYKPGQEKPEEVEVHTTENENKPYEDYIKVEPVIEDSGIIDAEEKLNEEV